MYAGYSFFECSLQASSIFLERCLRSYTPSVLPDDDPRQCLNLGAEGSFNLERDEQVSVSTAVREMLSIGSLDLLCCCTTRVR